MSKTTFKELANEWMQHHKKFIKESTCSTYAAHLENHILPLLGEHTCDEITAECLQNSILQWLDNGRKDGTGCLAEKTVKDIVVILKACIKYGAKNGYLPYRDIDLAIPSKKGCHKKISIFSVREQKLIANAVSNSLSNKTGGILISLYTGIRIGELCALKWSDIDFLNKTISISKTLQRLYFKDEEGNGYTKISITPPKTTTSIREIPISSKLMKTLKKLCPDNCDSYVLTNTEKYIEPRTYRNFYSRFLHNLNIRKLKFHCLRHTFATMCIESGADYKTVSELLGHANTNITMNLYVHPSLEQKRKCVELLDKII